MDVIELIESFIVEHDGSAYLYPDLPRPETQPEVAEAIQRFRGLPAEHRAEKPLWAWLLGSGTPPFKVSAADSQYVDDSLVAGQDCSNCEFLYFKPANQKYVCSQIRPYVTPQGWCNRWQLASKEADEKR